MYYRRDDRTVGARPGDKNGKAVRAATFTEGYKGTFFVDVRLAQLGRTVYKLGNFLHPSLHVHSVPQSFRIFKHARSKEHKIPAVLERHLRKDAQYYYRQLVDFPSVILIKRLHLSSPSPGSLKVTQHASPGPSKTKSPGHFVSL